MLEVLTAAASRNLTSLPRVKAALAITDDTQDAVLTEEIASASDAVLQVLGWFAIEERVREVLPGHGTNRLMLSRTPVTNVESVLHNGSAITDFTLEDPMTGLLYRARGWDWTAGTGWGLGGVYPIGRSEEPQFAVTYTGGWTVPEVADAFTLKRDIEKAVIKTIKVALEGGADEVAEDIAGAESIRIGPLQANFPSAASRSSESGGAYRPASIPSQALALLEPYRRWS